MSSGVIVRRNMHAYDVLLDGVLVGTVQKRVVRYNLRRVVTSTSWIATTPEGVRLSESGERTRAEAATRLVAAWQEAQR